jgi:hypothetical protein
VVARAEGFGEAEVDDFAEGSAAFWAKEGVFTPSFGPSGVFGLRDNIVVACHKRWGFIGH